MSVEQNKATLNRTYEEVWNKGNWSVVPEVIDPDYRYGDYKGTDGYIHIVNTFRNAFPDIHFTVEQVVGEEEWLAYHISAQGTFKNKLENIEPTGKEVKWTQAFFTQYKDGKVLTNLTFRDLLTFYQQMGMSPPGFVPSGEANKAVIRKTVEEIWNKGNVSLIPEQIAPDYVAHNAGMPDYRGQDGFREMVTGMRAAFPDLHYAIDNLVCEGDKVVCSCTITGTNTGAMMGVPPTGKKMSVKHTYISTVKDGKSVETWALADRLSIFQQLGITPPSPSG